MDELDFSELIAETQRYDDEWDPGFEGNRRIVVSKIGPFQRIFPRSRNFKKRFYHRVYDLRIEDWELNWDLTILSGFCVISSFLSLRFQSTFRYAQENVDVLPDINSQIKSNYQGLLKDAIEKELLRAEDRDLMSSGLEEIESNIETLIDETLLDQGVQCRARCRLEPTFKEIQEDAKVVSTGHFKHDQTVLDFMHHNFELQKQRDEERYRQEREEKHAQMEHREKLLKQSNHEVELERLREAHITESIKAEIEGEEQRKIERQKSEENLTAQRLESEERLLSQRLAHEARLEKLKLEAERKEKKERYHVNDEIENYERREIELLVLKRQHAILEREIEKITTVVNKEVDNGSLDGEHDSDL